MKLFIALLCVALAGCCHTPKKVIPTSVTITTDVPMEVSHEIVGIISLDGSSTYQFSVSPSMCKMNQSVVVLLDLKDPDPIRTARAECFTDSRFKELQP